MSDSSQRTEKPTPRRLEKARKEGRFPVSREALSAAVLATSVYLIIEHLPAWIEGYRALARFVIGAAFQGPLTIRGLLRLWQVLAVEALWPVAAAGGLVIVCALGVQMAMTGGGFSTAKLAPSFERLNPMSRLQSLPSQNLFQVAQATAVLAVFALILAVKMPDWLPSMSRLILLPLGEGLRAVGAEIEDLLKKAVLLFAAFGSVDYLRERMRFQKGLRMTKQEIRDEAKESEGNPQIKQRIRRLQRDALRRRMMSQVPKAAAVIVNPTHYAIALAYDPASLAAPKVVAKGRNYLARRIREIALAHEIPIIENPPLARSLYKYVEVGQEIPAQFYRAVAEILAYLYRLMRRPPINPARRLL
jgi:flagellar biosynthetic protein FlhB